MSRLPVRSYGLTILTMMFETFQDDEERYHHISDDVDFQQDPLMVLDDDVLWEEHPFYDTPEEEEEAIRAESWGDHPD